MAFEDDVSSASTLESQSAQLADIFAEKRADADNYQASPVGSDAETEIGCTTPVAFLQWMSQEVEKEVQQQSKSKRRQSWCISDALCLVD